MAGMRARAVARSHPALAQGITVAPARPGTTVLEICPMSVIALLATAAASAVAPVAPHAAPHAAPHCAWNHPGEDPYTGGVPEAVDRYTDMPATVRERIKARMQLHDYDDVVEISRDDIRGAGDYAPEIRAMHFGEGQVCGTVTRDAWPTTQRERALVYCEADHCVMVPTVCRNVSRIVRLTPPPPTGAGGPRPPGDIPPEMTFDPPGAGAPQPFGAPPLDPFPYPVPLTGPPSLLMPPLSVVPGGPLPPAPVAPPPFGLLPPGQGVTPPVDEPDIRWMLLLGAAMLAWVGHHRRRACAVASVSITDRC